MVRVINQETFDNIVKENVDDFEMTTEEAIEDAIKQLEAQGVNLSGIIKSAAMAEGKEPIVVCIKQLEDLLKLQSVTPLNITDKLKQLKEECSIDLAHKVIAGKHGAYTLVMDVLDKFSDDGSTVVLCLQTLTSCMDGFPDLLDNRGIMTIITLLQTSKNVEVIKNVLKWSKVCCINHENNRQAIVDSGIIAALKSLIEQKESGFLPGLLSLVRVLTLDDDVRSDVSKAHTHASSLAIELLCPITNLLAKYKEDKKMVSELLMTMKCLIVRNEFCAKVEEAGGIPFTINVLTEYLNDETIVRNCMLLLKGLAGNDDVKAKIAKADGPSLVLMALNRHQKSVGVCNAGLGFITIMALRSKENSKMFVDQGTPELLLQIMKVHPKELKVQRNCCWAIRNIVARSPNLSQPFLKLGAEELINAARRQHKEIDYDAKSALRDLGCAVNFNEQWKGKGQHLAA